MSIGGRLRRLIGGNPRDPVLAGLLRIDKQLAEQRFPGLSPWWLATVATFYESSARVAVVRKGRRVGASTIVAPRVAAAECLLHPLPEDAVRAGVRFVFALLSVRREEAAERLRQVAAVFDALGVAYTPTAETLELRDRPVAVMVRTASFRTVVGDSCIGSWCDELTRWRDGDGALNPSSEVIASLKPALLTLPRARMWLVSSPWSADDFHAQLFGRGNSDEQKVFHCTTWEANPQISKAETLALESNPRVWAREYLAQPGNADDSAFAADDLKACVDRNIRQRPRIGSHFAGGDFAHGVKGGDEHWVCVCHKRLVTLPGGAVRHEVVVDAAQSWPAQTPVDQIVTEAAALLRSFHVYRLAADQLGGEWLRRAFRQHGIRVEPVSMAPAAQQARFGLLQSMITEGSLRLLDHAPLVSQLVKLRERLRSGGRSVFEAPRGAHDDGPDALALAVEAARTGRACGSDSDMREVTDSEFFHPESGVIYHSHWERRVLGSRGEESWQVCAAPLGLETEEQKEDRIAKGILVPSDFDANDPMNPFRRPDPAQAKPRPVDRRTDVERRGRQDAAREDARRLVDRSFVLDSSDQSERGGRSAAAERDGAGKGVDRNDRRNDDC